MMKRVLGKFFFLSVVSIIFGNSVFSQDIPHKLVEIGRKDDAVALSALITKENKDVCYEDATALVILIRQKAMKCIDKLLTMGADINKACGEAKVPIFHVVKHGNLDMLKYFESRGANLAATYASEFSPNETLLEYAVRYRKGDMVQYLGSKK